MKSQELSDWPTFTVENSCVFRNCMGSFHLSVYPSLGALWEDGPADEEGGWGLSGVGQALVQQFPAVVSLKT